MIAACLLSCHAAGSLPFTGAAESEHIHADSNIPEFVESFSDRKMFRGTLFTSHTDGGMPACNYGVFPSVHSGVHNGDKPKLSKFCHDLICQLQIQRCVKILDRGKGEERQEKRIVHFGRRERWNAGVVAESEVYAARPEEKKAAVSPRPCRKNEKRKEVRLRR